MTAILNKRKWVQLLALAHILRVTWDSHLIVNFQFFAHSKTIELKVLQLCLRFSHFLVQFLHSFLLLRSFQLIVLLLFAEHLLVPHDVFRQLLQLAIIVLVNRVVLGRQVKLLEHPD